MSPILTPTARPTKTEGELLAALSPSKRWTLISKRHPGQFYGAIVSIIIASFVIVQGAFNLIPSLGSVFISTAQAAGKGESAFTSITAHFDLHWFVAFMGAIALLWSYGILSWATASEKIDAATKNIQTVQGFLFGLVIGKGAK
jgi:hypothetical protein